MREREREAAAGEMRSKKGSGKRRKISGNGGGCRISLLMRGLTVQKHDVVVDGLEYNRSDFYRIDIHKNNDISGEISICADKCFDSQYEFNCGGSRLIRVSGSSRIYNLPIALRLRDINRVRDNIKGIHCLKSVSWVDLNDNPKWTSGPIHECYVHPLLYACLGHNIYALWPGCLSEPMVLNTNNIKDGWLICTPPFPVDNLDRRETTGNIISDPHNQRIIFQLTDTNISSPVTYAWYPECDLPNSRWEIISDDIDLDTWMDNLPTLVDDDVIFFHRPNVFSAFHLKHKKWMRVCLSKSHSWPPHLLSRNTHHMFYLGHSRLCLAYSHQLPDDIFCENPFDYVVGCIVHLDIFHIQPHQSDPLQINIAHSFTTSITFDGIAGAADFLPLGSFFDD